MLLAACVLLSLLLVLVLLHAAHRAPVTALDEALSLVDSQIDQPVVRKVAA